MADLVAFVRARLSEDERVAREASGGTVVGERGDWRPAPGGDEWEPHLEQGGPTAELLVALRPGLPRPPDVMSGYWGSVLFWEPDGTQPEAGMPLPEIVHAARHDPARVLAEVDAKRRIIDQCAAVLADMEDRTDVDYYGAGDLAEATLCILALPYAGHPDREGRQS